LAFEKPQSGPAMVFTHRSKVGDESWARAFKTRESFDSVEFAYIDPATNIKETLKIPEDGGAKPNKVDSKGVRNYQQAFWLANRIRQKDKLRKVTVDFTSTEEGIYVVSGRAISVVKGSRVSTYDGYIIAQSGLTLTLSQNIEFTDGDMHYIQLKRRDGSVESVQVEPSSVNNRTVVMLSTPIEPIYTGNGAVKTEFSFGNEARHMAQMVIPATIEPNGDKTVKITGYNYDPDYYLFDNAQPIGGSFSNGFSNGFNI
jgi:predicted phage tail protein